MNSRIGPQAEIYPHPVDSPAAARPEGGAVIAIQARLQTMVPIPSDVQLEPPVLSLEVNRREFHLMVEAMRVFRELHCPLNSGSGWCPMLAAVESPVTGALERVCTRPCEEWLGELVDRAAGA